jgi:pyrroline-5-carboxylate reductase
MTTADPATLAFIGGGNMARALVGGLLQDGRDPGSLRVADPSPAARDHLRSRYPGLQVFDDNLAAADGAATWVLAVKPQHMRQVSSSLAALAQATRPLVISIAAGIRADDVAGWLGTGTPVIRSMPNRPALIGCGITALYARPDVDAAQKTRAAAILGAVGGHVWVEDESLMDAVTAVSGSGPAYVFLLVEMLESAARAEGLDPAVARTLVIETVFGAARLARESGEEPAVLREQVTSPGGTTAAALDVLERSDIRDTFARAIRAATQRSRKLAEEGGN